MTCEGISTEPGGLCAECFQSIRPLSPSHCRCCALPFSAPGTSSHLCAQCLRRLPSYHRAWAAFEYGGVVPHILHAAKFSRELAGLELLAQSSLSLLTGILQEFPLDGMVPVP
ncbi:MAG: double zinc ribbon domain-containing protein, partial [bacterium]|nr:double zinc ribbon domain-containing protein [bacterium]